MKTRTILIRTILTCVILLPYGIYAQTNLTEYGMNQIPQSVNQNPAFRPDASVVVGIPLLSSFSLSIYNTAFSFDDIFVSNSESDSMYFDLSMPANSKTVLNHFSQHFVIDLLMVGFRIKNTFLTFGIQNRLESRVFYNTDLIKLVWNGNENYIDETLDFSKSSVYENHFNNYYLGLAFPVTHNIDLGVRISFIQGLSNITTQNHQLSLLTESNQQTGLEFIAQTDFQVQTSNFSSLFYDSIPFSPADYFLTFQNVGFSIDVGVNARINDWFVLQASVVDFGKVNWHGDPVTYYSNTKEVNFSGVYYDFNTDNENNVRDVYLDSISNLLQIEENNNVYSTYLRTKLFVNGEANTLNKKNRFNLLFAGRFLEQNFNYALSFGYTFIPNEKLALKISYSYLKYAPLNFGLGFYINFKPFQFYVVTDNVTAFILPLSERVGNIHAGLTIVIPSKSYDIVPVQKK